MMSNSRELPGKFEEQLLLELQHKAVLLSASTADGLRRRSRLSGLAALTAATLLLAALFGTGSHANPAFAVDRTSGDTVTAEIYKFEDAAGLEQQLRSAGVNAVVNYVPAGSTCSPGAYLPVSGVAADAVNVDLTPSDGTALSVQVSKDALEDYTLIINGIKGISAESGSTSAPSALNDTRNGVIVGVPQLARGIGVLVVRGIARHCLPIPDPGPLR